ncbi:MAG: DUF4440 domain-containing protein, partial [Pedobacter sp.]
MRKLRLLLILTSTLFITSFVHAQSSDESTIRSILARQSSDWNKGDIAGFMKGYWESDSLMFIGKSGVTYGYNNTLENYRKSYPGPEAMGQLTFTLIKVKRLSVMYFQVIG